MLQQDLSNLESKHELFQGESKPVKILIADDHPLMRLALKEILAKERNFEIVAEASDGEEAVKLADQFTPDIIIMDISMPNLNGLEATKRIKAKKSDIGILILTVHSDNEHILGVLQAGADGYLTKNVKSSEVIHSVYALAAGETVMSPSISKKIFKYAIQHVSKPVALEMGEKLLAREIQIIKYLAQGMSNKDMSDRLGISQRTIKSYLSGIFLKLNVTSRTEVVVVSFRKGILTIDDLE